MPTTPAPNDAPPDVPENNNLFPDPGDVHLQEALFGDIDFGESLLNLLQGEPVQHNNELDSFNFNLDPILDNPAFSFTPHEPFEADDEGTWDAFTSTITPNTLEFVDLPNRSRERKRNAAHSEDGESQHNEKNSRKRRKKAKAIPRDAWQLQKPNIIRLYMEEERKLEDVKQLMETVFGFKATKKQFQDQLKKWGHKKNVQPCEKEAIIRKHLERQHASNKRPLRFFLRGVEVPPTKIDRWLKDWLKAPKYFSTVGGKHSRYGTAMKEFDTPIAPNTPSVLFCRTMSECSSQMPSLSHDQVAPDACMSGFSHWEPPRMRHVYDKVTPDDCVQVLRWSVTRVVDQIVVLLHDLLTDRDDSDNYQICHHLADILSSKESLEPWVNLFLNSRGSLRRPIHTHLGYNETSTRLIVADNIVITIVWQRTISQISLWKEHRALRLFINPNSTSIVSRSLCASVDVCIDNDYSPSLTKRVFTFNTRVPDEGVLFRAARNNDVANLQLLLQSNEATPNDRSSDGLSLLRAAAREGSPDTTLFLLQQGASIHDANGDQLSHILWSIWKGFLGRWSIGDPNVFLAEADLVRYKQVSDIAIRNDALTEYCLDYAVGLGNLLHLPCAYHCGYGTKVLNTLVQYFIQIGCDLEYRNCRSFTPLLEATFVDSGQMADYISALIEGGASIRAMDRNGRGPLHLVILGFYGVSRVADPPKCALDEMQSRWKVLLNAGCDASAIDHDSKTAADYIQHDSVRAVWDSLLGKGKRPVLNTPATVLCGLGLHTA